MHKARNDAYEVAGIQKDCRDTLRALVTFRNCRNRQLVGPLELHADHLSVWIELPVGEDVLNLETLLPGYYEKQVEPTRPGTNDSLKQFALRLVISRYLGLPDAYAWYPEDGLRRFFRSSRWTQWTPSSKLAPKEIEKEKQK
jgi:hypothetical protein